MQINYDTLRELNEEQTFNSKIWYVKNITPEECAELAERAKDENSLVIPLEQDGEVVAYEELFDLPDFSGATEGDR